jgi:hypothetical protein
MDNFLRPLNLGELLDRTAALYRTRFLLFAGISAVFAAAMLAVQLLHTGALRLMGYPNIAPHLQLVYAGSLMVNGLLVSLLAGLSIAASNRAVAWVYLGQPATVHSAVTSIFSRVGRFCWLMTQTMLRAWGPLIGVYVLLFVIIIAAGFGGGAFAPQTPHQPSTMGPGAAAGAIVVGLIALLLFFPATIYGVIMWLRYSLAMPACVVESLPAATAIRRSIDLSQGSRGRIFVLWLLVFIVRLTLGILLSFHAISQLFKHPGQPVSIEWMIFSQFSTFAVDTLIGPIYSIGLTLFYYDQRIRKEGYDIEWMMQAAGLLPQQTAGAPAERPTI